MKGFLIYLGIAVVFFVICVALWIFLPEDKLFKIAEGADDDEYLGGSLFMSFIWPITIAAFILYGIFAGGFAGLVALKEYVKNYRENNKKQCGTFIQH